jgi:hypothetical protein
MAVRARADGSSKGLMMGDYLDVEEDMRKITASIRRRRT